MIKSDNVVSLILGVHKLLLVTDLQIIVFVLYFHFEDNLLK